MEYKTPTFLKSNIVNKALMTFDKASGLIVALIWGAAIAFMGLAYVSVEQVLNGRLETAKAEAAVPAIPTIQQEALGGTIVTDLAARLGKQYGVKLNFAASGADLRISTSAAEAYNTWVSAITYLDTISGDTTWGIKELCIGVECRDGLMTITLTGKKVSFGTPEATEQ